LLFTSRASAKGWGMLKIHRTANGEVIFKISGQMDAENVADVKMSLESDVDGRPILLDLRDLTLVDRDAVTFLADCETDGVQIINCPAYIREWIARERAAG
jgi:anti-anti-sigma regulatory factor